MIAGTANPGTLWWASRAAYQIQSPATVGKALMVAAGGAAVAVPGLHRRERSVGNERFARRIVRNPGHGVLRWIK